MTAVSHLVVNGCSYNEVWAMGPGPMALAKDLGLSTCSSIARGGSANSRILRTTLKHSYQVSVPSLYLVGLTFLSRWELPIFDAGPNEQFEGRWINPQAHDHSEKIQLYWQAKDTKLFTKLKFKSATWACPDMLEDLMYRCIAVATDLRQRGHRVVFWNNCELAIPEIISDSRFTLLKSNRYFVNSLEWVAVPWQHDQGALPVTYPPDSRHPPDNLKHIHQRHYQYLNKYLSQWINDNQILA